MDLNATIEIIRLCFEIFFGTAAFLMLFINKD